MDAGERAVAAWGRARSGLVSWKTGQAGLVFRGGVLGCPASVVDEKDHQERDKQKAASRSSPHAHPVCNIQPSSKTVFMKGKAAPKRL